MKRRRSISFAWMYAAIAIIFVAAMAVPPVLRAQLTAPQQAADCVTLQKITPSDADKANYALLNASLCPAPTPPPVVTPPPVDPPPVTPGGLITALNHVGHFSLTDAFAYGGRGLVYNPAHNSLFVSCFFRTPTVAEVSIPSEATATVLQPCADATEGKSGAVNPGSPNDKVAGGYYIRGNQLVFSVYDYYDGAGTAVLSHFVRPLSLSTKGQVTGPFRVGPLGAGFYAGYFADIPSAWQAKLGGPVLIGNGGLNIISRTSYGPAGFVIDPATIGVSQGALPLVYYPKDHPTLGNYGTAGVHPLFNGTTRITGAVFPKDTSTVLFFGRTGFGNYCYGEASDCGHDTAEKYKGTHAQPYGYFIWAYDANELAAVKAGTKQPWDVKPYATWEPLPRDGGWDQLLGTAYDPATGRIFVESQQFDSTIPTVHIFSIIK